jgi:hypothetical protein
VRGNPGLSLTPGCTQPPTKSEHYPALRLSSPLGGKVPTVSELRLSLCLQKLTPCQGLPRWFYQHSPRGRGAEVRTPITARRSPVANPNLPIYLFTCLPITLTQNQMIPHLDALQKSGDVSITWRAAPQGVVRALGRASWGEARPRRSPTAAIGKNTKNMWIEKPAVLPDKISASQPSGCGGTASRSRSDGRRTRSPPDRTSPVSRLTTRTGNFRS